MQFWNCSKCAKRKLSRGFVPQFYNEITGRSDERLQFSADRCVIINWTWKEDVGVFKTFAHFL